VNGERSTAEFIVISTTAAQRTVIEDIAALLVREEFAACAQIEAVESHYRWNGKLERESEWRCTLKTRASLFDLAAARIAELHDYELPEIVATPIVTLSDGYAAWLRENTRDA
jgi:periplasmic divalent cation tolerance protein